MGAVVVETTEIPKKPSIEFEAKEVTTIPISFFYRMKKLKGFQLADILVHYQFIFIFKY